MGIWDYIVLAFVGGLGGTLNVIAGGGSLLIMPTLVLMGLDGAVANGTSRVAVLVQNLSAVTAFWKKGYSDFKLSLSLSLCGIPGAVIGGLVLGVGENVGAGVTSSGYKDLIVFVILILILLFRQRGFISGQKTVEET